VAGAGSGVRARKSCQGDVALQRTQYLFLCPSQGGSLGHVGAGLGPHRILTSAIVVSALFSCRSPPQLSRWRCVLPEDAGIGQVPARQTNAVSERTRPGVGPGDEDGRGHDGPDTGHLWELGGLFGD
jgi:hypothetical protein